MTHTQGILYMIIYSTDYYYRWVQTGNTS